ncbi:MAG: VOC family protein [Pirellulaceae bacterium]
MKQEKKLLVQFILSVLICLCLAVFALADATGDQEGSAVNGVAGVAINVADMDRSVAFFRDVLDFQVASERTDEQKRTRSVELQIGDERVWLNQDLTAAGQPVPPDSRANDHWFQHIAIVVSDIDRAYQRLREFKVRHASSGPQTLPEWNKNAAGIQAFYFRDPDGHFLEIISFPPGKGDPKWQRESDGLFLGIDHTAIVVADTDSSLKFYRDLLGMKVAGHSENYGTEQEHLNGVFGARLRITALRAETGPGVELLEYISPTDGRKLEREPNENDLVRWRILMQTRDGSPSNLLDPDGHAIEISGSNRE